MFFGNQCAQAVVRNIAMARDLIDRKLAEQQCIVREAFHNVAAAHAIEEIRSTSFDGSPADD